MTKNEAHEVVDACAAQRDANPPAPMTVERAMDHAQALRRVPEMILDTKAAKQTIEALHAAIESSPCFHKAVRLGLRSFVLLPYDRAAIHALDEWIKQAETHGCREEKLADARAVLSQWMQRPDLRWPT